MARANEILGDYKRAKKWISYHSAADGKLMQELSRDFFGATAVHYGIIWSKLFEAFLTVGVLENDPAVIN